MSIGSHYLLSRLGEWKGCLITLAHCAAELPAFQSWPGSLAIVEAGGPTSVAENAAPGTNGPGRLQGRSGGLQRGDLWGAG